MPPLKGVDFACRSDDNLTSLVAASLSQSWERWQEIGAKTWVLNVLRFSSLIPFISQPTLSSFPIPFGSYFPNSIKGKALDGEIRSLVQREL